MGVSSSKTETCEPLRLCKERKRYMKQAIESRYDLAAAHVVYVQSLHNIGIAIGKFAETEIDCNNSANNSNISHMKSSGVSAVTVNINPSQMFQLRLQQQVYEVETSELIMSPPPPPPPLPPRFSWDYFDPTDGSFRLMQDDRVKHDQNAHCDDHITDTESHGSSSRENTQIEPDPCSDSEDGCLTDRISAGGKDIVSCIKDIEDWFIRASKSGDEISRMLEANKIQISYTEANGGSPSSLLTCFTGGNTYEAQETTKVITWKRSMSSSPPLLCLLGPPSNQDNFVQEFCMIAGSHSSTLDRLYAWERKLYDEVKASESIRKEYDKKCDELRHQFAMDHKPHLIDRTRAAAKDLHSRMRVALHTVDSVSKRIEKVRDEELQPQLMELIQGLMRMWKSMLEFHHAQCTTITSANHSRTRTHHIETNMVELEHEVECFGSTFSDLVKSYASYVESINNWLQNCIIQPKERVKGRRAFSPRRAVAPPIFIMCRDWSAGIRSLPSQKVSDVIKELLCHIHRISVEEEMKIKELSLNENGEKKIRGWKFSMVDGSLTKVFDRLTNYCEESLKMYEEIKERSETAGNLYLNYRPPTRPSII